MELYDLSNDLKKCKNGKEFIHKLIDKYQKLDDTGKMKQNNFFYIIGTIDALYFSGNISQEDYTLFYKYFGL